MDVLYNDLASHFVDFDSPFGRGKIKKNAKEYVDEQLAIIEEDYYKMQEDDNAHDTSNYEKDVNTTLQLNTPIEELKPIVEEIQNTIVLFRVSVNGIDYVVVINNTGYQSTTDQLNLVIGSPFFVGQITKEEIKPGDTVISYYQYHNLVQYIPKPKQDLSAYEMISGNIDTLFDGVKLEGF
jgi:hypothetical protein